MGIDVIEYAQLMRSILRLGEIGYCVFGLSVLFYLCTTADSFLW